MVPEGVQVAMRTTSMVAVRVLTVSLSLCGQSDRHQPHRHRHRHRQRRRQRHRQRNTQQLQQPSLRPESSQSPEPSHPPPMHKATSTFCSLAEEAAVATVAEVEAVARAW